jgi:hypothetical protein
MRPPDPGKKMRDQGRSSMQAAHELSTSQPHQFVADNHWTFTVSSTLFFFLRFLKFETLFLLLVVVAY